MFFKVMYDNINISYGKRLSYQGRMRGRFLYFKLVEEKLIMNINSINRTLPQYSTDKAADSSKGNFVEILRGAVSGPEKRCPYQALARDGIIEYNGVTFVCDFDNNRITLGDVSNKRDCITVALSEGGSLVVNRDNLSDLSKAIGMFSPEDVNRILRAITLDNKVRQMQQELDDEEDGVISMGAAENFEG